MARSRLLINFWVVFNSIYSLSNAQNASPQPYASPSGLSNDISAYLAASTDSGAGLAKSLMFANINVVGSANGTVIAAQSYSSPDYAYNWVRDASLTMDVVQSLYNASASQTAQLYYAEILFSYANARTGEQNDSNLQTGLGEPKFNLDNSVFTGPWGRPQNDGPATSSITLMQFATAYLANGGSIDTVNEIIYQAPVKSDLLFVASNWSSPSFDIWEEESSYHFYNRLVSHRALSMGASFASTMGDPSTQAILASAADDVAGTLSQFWDQTRGIIVYENGPVLNNKISYLDIAVILGIIHGYNGDGIFSYSDDQVLATAYQLAISFLNIYPVASQHTDSNGDILGIPTG
jgi:glucoamylase